MVLRKDGTHWQEGSLKTGSRWRYSPASSKCLSLAGEVTAVSVSELQIVDTWNQISRLVEQWQWEIAVTLNPPLEYLQWTLHMDTLIWILHTDLVLASQQTHHKPIKIETELISKAKVS